MWIVWLAAAIALWSVTNIFYKKGAVEDDPYVSFRFSIITGIIFALIAAVYLVTREEDFTIWESMLRFWPVTLFSIVYPIINTITYQGFLYTESSIYSAVGNTANGTYVVILVIVYMIIGKIDSIWDVLNVYKVIGICAIFVGLVLLAVVQQRIANKERADKDKFKFGVGSLIFPLVFSVMDGLETVVSGVCLDKNYGYAMPEGDAVIIVALVYAIFAFGFWVYVSVRKKQVYNPFQKENASFFEGALCDNFGIVCYSYAMALDSVSTDPILAIYPMLTMFFAKIILKEKLSFAQYFCMILMVFGSVMMVVGHAAS